MNIGTRIAIDETLVLNPNPKLHVNSYAVNSVSTINLDKLVSPSSRGETLQSPRLNDVRVSRNS